MKKVLLSIACTLLVGFLFTGCNNSQKKGEGEKESTTVQKETAPAAEETTDNTTPKAKDAIKALEDIVKWGEDIQKKSDKNEISKDDALKYFLEFVSKASDFEKQYGSLTEEDFSPKQFKRYEELKAKLGEMVNVKTK